MYCSLIFCFILISCENNNQNINPNNPPNPSSVQPLPDVSKPGEISPIQRTHNKTSDGKGIDISFVDDKHGWKMNFLGVSDGNGSVEIHQTSDGGKTWNKVSATDKNMPDPKNPPEGILPLAGDKTGLSFLNTTIGWITGTSKNMGTAWIYSTQDGGKTWHPQDFLIPSSYKSSVVILSPPTFLGQVGIMPVKFNSKDQTVSYLFFTKDGGLHWSDSKQIPGKGSWETLKWDFGNPDNGTITINNNVWKTADGGYSWGKTGNLKNQGLNQ